jgi:hypothetical protein
MELPRHAEPGRTTRVIEALSIAVALGLLTLNLARLSNEPPALSWTLVAAVALGAFCADFASGLVHWLADTWGSESMPVLGRRLIHPFRVHHVNPRDLLRRGVVDCNGDVALLTCPVFLAAWLAPLTDEASACASLFLLALATTALPTNQVHQWAHQSEPPRPVAWLQRAGLILGRAQHARHHTPPFAANYCIATGWCNRGLGAIGFFPALERLITRVTGVAPRQDDRSFADRQTA